MKTPKPNNPRYVWLKKGEHARASHRYQNGHKHPDQDEFKTSPITQSDFGRRSNGPINYTKTGQGWGGFVRLKAKQKVP